MTTEEFNTLVEMRCQSIKNVLAKKAVEYSAADNRLHNFDRGVQLSGQSREKVLLGMMLKHEISVLDIVDNIEKNNLPTVEMVDEKLGDWINYLILLEASIKQKIKKQPINELQQN